MFHNLKRFCGEMVGLWWYVIIKLNSQKEKNVGFTS